MSTRKEAQKKHRVVAGVDIDRTYSPEEIFEMHDKGRLRPITLEGYCTRADEDGIRFVPYYESTFFRMREGKPQQHVSHDFAPAMRAQLEADHPITRRTPQQRVASMVLRLLADAKQNGTIAGLSEEQIRSITGELWKAGVTEVSTEMVRKVAAHFLFQAEKGNREADSHRVARAHPTA